MAVFSDEQPLGLHLYLQPLNGFDHRLRREQLAGGATEAVQLTSGRVGAEGHLLFGRRFGNVELVASHG